MPKAKTQVKAVPKAKIRAYDYDPAYCDKVTAHMSKGFSFESFAATLNCSLQTIRTWVQSRDDFFEARERGYIASQKFWEELGINGASGRIKEFNVTCWIFNMKNRFGWRDRQDIYTSQKAEVVITPENYEAIWEKARKRQLLTQA